MSMHLRGSRDMMGREESWWQSRTGLEQKLIILSTVLFIVTFSLTITVIVFKNRSPSCPDVTTPSPNVTEPTDVTGSTSVTETPSTATTVTPSTITAETKPTEAPATAAPTTVTEPTTAETTVTTEVTTASTAAAVEEPKEAANGPGSVQSWPKELLPSPRVQDHLNGRGV